MKIKAEYKDGELNFEGTPTEEEKELYEEVKRAGGKAYNTFKGILENIDIEGSLEIKVTKKGG